MSDSSCSGDEVFEARNLFAQNVLVIMFSLAIYEDGVHASLGRGVELTSVASVIDESSHALLHLSGLTSLYFFDSLSPSLPLSSRDAGYESLGVGESRSKSGGLGFRSNSGGG